MNTPISKSHPNSRAGVRVVGKIRPFLASEAQSSCSISLTRSVGDHASIQFGDQNNGSKDCYKLDWCYGQDEDVSEVFSKEVKPLKERLLEGFSSCVVAFGARGSGKTQLIQGTEEKHGVALMEIQELLPVVAERGGDVNISMYEVNQDHIYDLLQPKGKEVLVMEDRNQRIQLKGLSQVAVKSISEVKDLLYHGHEQQRPIQNDVAVKSHRGMIVYVSYGDKDPKQFIASKMNFVDLAGYAEIRKIDNAHSTLSENAKANKPIYALLNVVQTLNSNGNYVPYRESKLTRLLQDFLSGSTTSVLVTCMNPVPCQDTVRSVHMASRSCQAVNKYQHDSIKNIKSASRLIPSSSPKGRIRTLDSSMKKLDLSVEKTGYGTPSKKRLQPLGSSFKKTGTSIFGPIKKGNNSSVKKGRKPLNLTSPVTKLDKEICVSGKVITSDAPKDVGAADEKNDMETRKRAQLVLEADVEIGHKKQALIISENIDDVKADTDVGAAYEKKDLETNENGPSVEVGVDAAHEEKDLEMNENGPSEVHTDPEVSSTEVLESNLSTQLDDNIKNLNHNLDLDNEVSTPRVTDKLREISNSLKLWSLKEISISTPQDLSRKNKIVVEGVNPQTPAGLCTLDSSKFEDGTPKDIWRARSTGLKESLAKECLSFLNSANKEELKSLKGIGERRATYILELREEDPEPFKEVDDLKNLGLSSKQIKGLISNILGDI